MKRVLLIDADVLAYNAAFANEKAFEVEPGYWTWNVAWEDVVETFDAELFHIQEQLKGDEVRLCLTDSEGNFRHRVLPTYKGGRKSVRKPIVLKAFKQYLIDERGAYFRPGLEGDDCMGILATVKSPNERIIVSVDKDMKTVPGLVCRWPIEKKPRLISEQEADYWHLFQTLTGDTTDGYSGLPGCGPVKAAKVLDNPDKDNMPRTRGEMWARVREAYVKAGFTVEDALQQARVARILRASDYDFATKKPILWTPSA